MKTKKRRVNVKPISDFIATGINQLLKSEFPEYEYVHHGNNMDKLEKIWLVITTDELRQSQIEIWRMRLAIWLVDTGVRLGDWAYPYERHDK